MGGIKGALKSFGGFLSDAWHDTTNTVKRAGNALSDAGDTVYHGVRDIGSSIGGSVKDAYDQGRAALNDARDTVTGSVADAWDTVRRPDNLAIIGTIAAAVLTAGIAGAFGAPAAVGTSAAAGATTGTAAGVGAGVGTAAATGATTAATTGGLWSSILTGAKIAGYVSLAGSAAMQGYGAYQANKYEKEMAREQERANQEQLALAKEAAEQSKYKASIATVGASADYSQQATINAELSQRAADQRKKRAFSYSQTLNNTNLLGAITGKTVLGG